MINLLPGAVKEQLRYARLNALALKYMRLLIAVMITLTGVFGASLYFLRQEASALAKDVADKQAAIAQLAPKTKEAQTAADRLKAIKAVQASQTRFSLLLDDLAKVLPKGVSLDSITLTGDDTKPVQINVVGIGYNSILEFRDAIVQSPRIGGADLVNVTQAGTTYTASVVIGFKPGMAK